MENKMTVIAKDGQALIGNHFHTLKDKTKLSFDTDDISSFLEYIGKKTDIEMSVFADENRITAMPAAIDQNAIAIASCALDETSYIKTLRGLNGKKMIVEEAEKVMRFFRSFTGAVGKQILDFCKSAHIEDTVKIDREKSNTGEYEFSVTRKRSGKEKWSCPESIGFKVQIFKNINECRDLTFETSFDYEEVEGKVKMMFTFSSLDFENIINFNKREIIATTLKDLNRPKYWGRATIEKMNDSWQYKANPMTA